MSYDLDMRIYLAKKRKRHIINRVTDITIAILTIAWMTIVLKTEVYSFWQFVCTLMILGFTYVFIMLIMRIAEFLIIRNILE